MGVIQAVFMTKIQENLEKFLTFYVNIMNI